MEKLILKLAVPTIISMLVTAFYNLADTFFIRQLNSDSMVAAIGVVMPLMNIIQAVGFYHGHGSGNFISRAYGRQDLKNAEKKVQDLTDKYVKSIDSLSEAKQKEVMSI